MIYIVEIDNGFGKLATKEYEGLARWDVVADAEADIRDNPHCHIKRVWVKGEEPVGVLPDRHQVG